MSDPTPAPPETPDFPGKPEVLQLLGVLGGLSGALGYLMQKMDAMRAFREEQERLRLIEIDDRLYEHYVSSCLNGLLAEGAGNLDNLNDDERMAVAVDYAERLLAAARARRSPELRLEIARAALAKMGHDEVLALAKEYCSDIRNLVEDVEREAKHDPKLDSMCGTFRRVLRERDQARADVEQFLALQKKHSL